MGDDLDRAQRLDRILRFLEISAQFKAIERATYLADGRLESDAEHAWHAGLFALLLHQDLAQEVDIGHVLVLLTVHDLVEIYAGDTFGYDETARHDKPQREAVAADRLFAVLPADLTATVRGWWEEYEAGQTPAARFAKSMDRLQVLAQNVYSRGRMWRERGVTEAMSRAKNRETIGFDPWVTEAFEALYRRANRERLWGTDTPPTASDG